MFICHKIEKRIKGVTGYPCIQLFHGYLLEEAEYSMVVSKTKHSKTKTEAQSTQISKTKHPKLENEAPYLENEAP